jgi:hypothetical protein
LHRLRDPVLEWCLKVLGRGTKEAYDKGVLERVGGERQGRGVVGMQMMTMFDDRLRWALGGLRAKRVVMEDEVETQAGTRVGNAIDDEAKKWLRERMEVQ